MDVQYGYPREIFLSVPDERFTCHLCLEILRDPVQCINGHLFCRCCLEKALEVKRKCPTCRHKTNCNNMSESLITKSFIGEMSVKCITTLNSDEDEESGSCTWIGRADELIAHLNDNCQFVYMDCLNEECDEILSRTEMCSHMMQCDWSARSCQHCDEMQINRNMTIHCMECTSRPVMCPNQCSSTPLKQSALDAHLSLHCPLVLVQCAYHETGCGVDCDGFILRGDKEQHENHPDNMKCVIKALFKKVDTLLPPASQRQQNVTTGANNASITSYIRDNNNDQHATTTMRRINVLDNTPLIYRDSSRHRRQQRHRRYGVREAARRSVAENSDQVTTSHHLPRTAFTTASNVSGVDVQGGRSNDVICIIS